MEKYIVYDINYDDDGIETELPIKLEINVPDHITEREDIEEFLGDEISNITGFCHTEFYYIKPIKK
jgi:hypothetical protein